MGKIRENLTSFSLLTTIVALYPTTLSAQEMSFYIGAGAGITDAEVNERGLESNLEAALASEGIVVDATVSADDEDYGWKAVAGVQLHKHFAIEGGYIDLGELNIAADFGTAPVTAAAEFDADAWNLVAVGIAPINNNLSAFAKAGAYFWDAKLAATATSGATTVSDSASDDGTDLTYGLGMQYELDSGFGLRAEWERFEGVGNDNTTGEGDIDLISVSIIYRF